MRHTVLLIMVLFGCVLEDDPIIPPNQSNVIDCKHSPCEEGEPLWQTCQPCVYIICEEMPSCCGQVVVIGDPISTTWDEECVAAAELYCPCAGVDGGVEGTGGWP